MKVDTIINAIQKLETRAAARALCPREERQLSNFTAEAWDRLLYTPNKSLYGTQKSAGKHKLPRFMYHITTEDSYLSMLSDGKIKPAQCMDSASGVFLLDLKNFARFWTKNKDTAEQPRTTLLDMVCGKSEPYLNSANIVLLRIPTSALDARTLRLRRQKLCRMGHGNLEKETEKIMQDKHKFSNALKELKYMMQGESIEKAPLYNQRKEAVEYITPDEIPINQVSLIGKIGINKEYVEKAHRDMKDLPEIWKSLTQGQSEYKLFERVV